MREEVPSERAFSRSGGRYDAELGIHFLAGAKPFKVTLPCRMSNGKLLSMCHVDLKRQMQNVLGKARIENTAKGSKEANEIAVGVARRVRATRKCDDPT